MLAITSFMLSSVHGMRCVAVPVPSVRNRICKMGMRAAKEKMLSTADRMLNSTVSTRYFL